MNAYDKQEINERLDLAISMVESYNRDISSMVSGDLYAYIGDKLMDGVDVASVEYYLRDRYVDQENILIELDDARMCDDGQDYFDDINIIEKVKLMDSDNINDVPMVDRWELYPDSEVKQVTTHDIIKYLESCKY